MCVCYQLKRLKNNHTKSQKHQFTFNYIIINFSILFTDVDIQNRFQAYILGRMHSKQTSYVKCKPSVDKIRYVY